MPSMLKNGLMKWRNMPLKYKLIINIALVNSLFLGIFITDLFLRQQRFLVSNNISDTVNTAWTLSVSVKPWVLSRDYIGLSEIAHSYKNDITLRYVFITDASGEVLAHSGDEHLGEYLSDVKSRSIITGSRDFTIVNNDSDNIAVAHTVRKGTDIIGWVWVCYSNSGIQAGLNRILINGLVLILAAAALGTLLAFIFSRFFTGRLYRLLKAVNDTAAGKRDSRADMSVSDELGQLSSGFNTMLDALITEERNLINARNNLSLLNQELEDRVLARTREADEARKSAEKIASELKEALELNRLMITSSSLGIFACMEKGPCIMANPAIAKITGTTLENVLKLNFRHLVMWRENGLLEKAEEALATGIEQRAEVHTLSSYGRELWISYSITRFTYSGTNHFLMIVDDISERKNLENESRNNEMRLRSLVQLLQYHADDTQKLLDLALEEAITLTGSKIGYLYFYNEESREFVLNSWSRGVMKECSVTEPQTVYQLEKTGIWGEAVRQRKEIIVNEYREENPLKKGYPEGHVQLEKFLTIPLFSDERIVAVVGVANKATDYLDGDVIQLKLLMSTLWGKVENIRSNNTMKQQAGELEKLNRELKRSNKELDDFAYIASHDLKEPLRSISNFSAFLLEDYEAVFDDEGKRKLNVLIDQSRRLENFIDALLRYSRIGREVIRYEQVDLNEIISQVRVDIASRLLEENVRIEIERDLPVVQCSPVFIREVYMNLISNAIKYNESSEKIVTLGYRDGENGGPAVLSVRDNGIGIQEKNFDSIFKIFRRLHGREKYGGGTGAGLTIVKKLIDAQKGRIWLESEPGRGSTFYFTIEG